MTTPQNLSIWEKGIYDAWICSELDVLRTMLVPGIPYLCHKI